MSKLSDAIREYVQSSLVEPARQRGDKTLTVRVGDIHRAMNLLNRVPAVCQALTTGSFLKSNRLLIEKRDGPPSGQGTNVIIIYRLLADERTDQDKWDQLFTLRGAGKDMYARLGGGEAVIQQERAQFIDLNERRSGAHD